MEVVVHTSECGQTSNGELDSQDIDPQRINVSTTSLNLDRTM